VIVVVVVPIIAVFAVHLRVVDKQSVIFHSPGSCAVS